MPWYSRRDALGAAGVAAAGALSGCGLLSSDSGDPVTTTGPPLPYSGSTSPPYRPWLYAPSVIGKEVYTFASSNLKELPDSAIGIADLPFREITGVRVVDGIGVDITDHAHVLPTGFVITGNYRLGPLRESMRSVQDLEPVEEYKTVTLWSGPSPNLAVGVKPDLVIMADVQAFPALDMVKTLIDVATGEVDRYTDVSQTCAELVGRLPQTTGLAFRPRGDEISLANVEGTGIGWTVGAETAEVRHLFVYPDTDSVETGSVEALVEDHEFFEGFENVRVTADGCVAVLDATTIPSRTGKPLLPPWMPAGMNQPP